MTGTIDSGIAMPRLAALRATRRTETIDLAPLIGSYKICRPLRSNAALFATARLTEDGELVAFADEKLEMTVDMMENLAEQKMTPTDLATFLARNRLTQQAAGALLGRSRRQIGYYLEREPVSRIVALACREWEAMGCGDG